MAILNKVWCATKSGEVCTHERGAASGVSALDPGLLCGPSLATDEERYGREQGGEAQDGG